ncbi:hypothetical protein J2S55_008292 [Streptosporangium brasiliense]|uniref:Uncharacterized protein n=1 Tax=Streptosporangium brasiliense TaxID=47480 RepID=A0ABT9RIA4_9ACTN|nr:hypothetical protein [Streptosporangium brasiliense]
MRTSGSSNTTRTVMPAMMDRDGRLDGPALYEMAELRGLTDQRVRVCLRGHSGWSAVVDGGLCSWPRPGWPR